MKIDESNISKFNFITILLLVIFFAVAIIYSSYSSKEKSFEELRDKLQTKFIEDKKKLSKENVLTIHKFLKSNANSQRLTLSEKKEYILNMYKELNKDNPYEYYFVFDLIKDNNEYVQKILLHPLVPFGKVLDKNIKDLDGNLYVQKYQEDVLKNGSTFLEYSFVHPKTKKEKYKKAFILLDKEFNWIVGSGFFMSDINSQLIKIENNLKKNIKKELKRDIVIALIFLIVLILLVVLVNRITSKTINKFKKEVENERQKLEDSEGYLKQYLSIIEKSNIVSKTDLEGNIIYVSDSFCDITGYSKDELIGNTHAILRHPETTNDFFDNMWYLIKSKYTFKALVRNVTKDKNTIYLNTTISPILDKNGEIVEFIAHRFDITKETLLQKELERQNSELTKSQDILKEAQRIAHIGNWEYDFNSNLITFSDEAIKIFSLENNKKTIHIDDFKKIFFPEDLMKIEEIFNKSFHEKTKFYNEHRIIGPDGKISYVEINAIYQHDNKGTPIRTLCTVHDVSQKNKAQKELQEKDLMLLQQSKMASMGEMLSNIAHQWRQPLSVISTAATGAKVLKEIGQYNGKEFDETMSMINNSVQYLSRTIDDFRNFFKPDENMKQFKISNTIDKTLGLVSPQFKSKDILIIKEVENFQINGMENELLQVLINIMNNARDQLLKNNLGKKIIFIKTYSDEENLFIKIKDTGTGIPEKNLDRIFEPYFTTKHKSEGTGIGLYMCEEIIVKHMKGTIYARNCSGQYEDYNYTGAEFVIKLPKEG